MQVDQLDAECMVAREGGTERGIVEGRVGENLQREGTRAWRERADDGRGWLVEAFGNDGIAAGMVTDKGLAEREGLVAIGEPSGCEDLEIRCLGL